MGYPGELQQSGTNRRPGVENGPSQFCKALKFSTLKPIDKAALTVYDCFDFFGTDIHHFSEQACKNQYQLLRSKMQPRDLLIGLGGSSSILNFLSSASLEEEVIVKISPLASRGAKGGSMNNSNYVTYLEGEYRERIIHFALVDYLNHKPMLEQIAGEDKARVQYLDSNNTKNVEAFAALLEGLASKKGVCVLWDLESLRSDGFPGVSGPSIYGLTQHEAFRMVELLATCPAPVTKVLFSNYNPTVEPRKSGDMLVYMIYHLLTCAQ